MRENVEPDLRGGEALTHASIALAGQPELPALERRERGQPALKEHVVETRRFVVVH